MIIDHGKLDIPNPLEEESEKPKKKGGPVMSKWNEIKNM